MAAAVIKVAALRFTRGSLPDASAVGEASVRVSRADNAKNSDSLTESFSETFGRSERGR